MGRYAGIDILAENLAHLLPAEVTEDDTENISSTCESSATPSDDLDELIAQLLDIACTLEEDDDDKVTHDIAMDVEALREIFSHTLTSASDVVNDKLRELSQLLEHLRDTNRRWTELESLYTSLDCTTNGWIPEEGWWLTAKCFDNKADLAIFHSNPPPQPSDHLLSLRLHIPQGGVLLLEQWRQELNNVVAVIEEVAGQSQRVGRQKASIEAIYSAGQAASPDRDYSNKTTSMFMTAPVYFGGASLATLRDHGPNVAKTLAGKLNGGQMTLSPFRYNYLLVESFVRAGAYKAGAAEDARQCMELFM